MTIPEHWRELDHAHLVHPLHNVEGQKTSRLWVRGEGALLFDSDGRAFIDAISGLWNVAVGHGRAELADVASAQMKQMAYCSGYSGSTNASAIELASRLAELCYPSINRFFFTSGGAESNDAAFKTARYYWKCHGKPSKVKVISRKWGYHGVTLASMSATGIASYWPMFEPRTPGFTHIASPYPYRYPHPMDGRSQGRAAADELEQAILREGPETVAMFLAEPVQGAAGVIVPQDDYFPRIREICDQYDVLLAADEVITGFGRTGLMFGLQHWDVEPDLIQFAKGITSGYFPFGGVGFCDRIAAVFDEPERTWMHAYTYSGHPVGSAVALRNLQIIEDERLVEAAGTSGNLLLDQLRTELADHPHVGDIRGLGLMCGVELVENRETKKEFDAELKIGQKLHEQAQKRGMFTRMRGDVICLAPPLSTPLDVLQRIAPLIGESLRSVLPE
jgi:adenosylmethionine-8-amino-7-oxononanoate aminotransferase